MRDAQGGNGDGRDLLLTLDQGGQSAKALVFDREVRVQASETIPVTTSRPRAGRVEQDPAEILASVQNCLESIAGQLGTRLSRIGMAGLATQRSSVVCWDRRTGEPLSPVLSWQDRRAEEQVRGLREGAERVRHITGLVLSAHYGASKIRWCLDHLPAVQTAARQQRLVCGPLATFLLHHLCVERPLVVDPAIAARTLLFDLQRRKWSAELLEMFGISESVLPECVPNRCTFGRIRVGSREVPLVVSTGDQAAALFAWGRPAADTVVINLGTGAFVQRACGARPAAAPGLLESVVWDDGNEVLFALEGSINGCGSALETLGAELGLDMEEISGHAADWLRGDTSVLFLNGVSGLGSPYWVADYPTQMLGSGSTQEIMQAVLESIVFLLQVNLEEIERQLGRPRHIRVAGGLAAVRPLCQRLADLSGLQVERSELHEATALGLAFLLADSFSIEGSAPRCERFTPREDKELYGRYCRWRRELESRLPVT